jgi:hypothetical protein
VTGGQAQKNIGPGRNPRPELFVSAVVLPPGPSNGESMDLRPKDIVAKPLACHVPVAGCWESGNLAGIVHCMKRFLLRFFGVMLVFLTILIAGFFWFFTPISDSKKQIPQRYVRERDWFFLNKFVVITMEIGDFPEELNLLIQKIH